MPYQGHSWRVPRSVVVSWTRIRVSVYPACFPPTIHKMAPPSLPGVPRVVPPDQWYYEVLRLLAARLAALRFLRLAIPPFRPSFVPVGLGRGPRINLELLSRVSGRRCDGGGKVSQVPVKPVRSSAMFLRPRCDRARLWVQVELMPGSAPASVQ